MSAFAVTITPTRVKNAQKTIAAREPTCVVLAPFSAKSIVTFEDIPITKTAKRYLNIQNTSENALQVQVTKTINPEMNAFVEWTSKEIPANGTVSMEIIWSPMTVTTTKAVIQFTDNRQFKKDVSIIFKSIDRSATASSSSAAATAPHKRIDNRNLKKKTIGIIPKVMKIKSPPQRVKTTAKTITSMRKTITNTMFSSNQTVITEISESSSSNHRPTRKDEISFQRSPLSQNAINICKNSTANLTVQGKENKSPTTPTNVSHLFDQINFTMSNTKDTNYEYLALLPTPTNIHARTVLSKTTTRKFDINTTEAIVTHNLSNEMNFILTPTRANCMDASRLCALQTPITVQQHVNDDFEPYVCSTVDRSRDLIIENEVDSRRKLFVTSPTAAERLPNKTFDTATANLSPFKNFSFSPKLSPLSANKMPSNITPGGSHYLSVIKEESPPHLSGDNGFSSENLQKTYNIATADATKDSKDFSLVGTPLRKKFQSMKDLSNNKSIDQQMLKNNQGSMPNLGEIVAVKSIDNNRYYYQSVEKELQQQQQLQQKNLLNFSTCSNISAISTVEPIFKETEILAQSSRFNLNEVGKSIKEEPESSSESIESCREKVVFFVPTNKNTTVAMKSRLKVNVVQPQRPSVIQLATSTPQQFKRSREISDSETPKGPIKQMSPPKRSRYDENCGSSFSRSSSTLSASSASSSSKGQSFRTKSWGAVKPKKLIQIPKMAVQQLILKKQREERVFLFDPDLRLQGVINPDPFAATTTNDPFLAATMYLDEQCVDKHETHFKKWLNALVTVPDELDGSPHKQIDFGRLFNEVRHKELNLAQTKEVASSNYFTKYRMDSLRRAAINLYVSSQMDSPIQLLTVQIEKKLISIRQDRDLHLDMVLQRNMLELLLCFNPLWLRLGLEVVFGEIIFMKTNADIVSLSTFILNRLFKDSYLEQKHSKSYARQGDYGEYVKKFSLKKLLVLLLFLDQAKDHKIIPHNPCLFLKTSQYKETKEILLRMSSALLANVGDIQRDLKRIGIVLTHKQTYIDEFDYAFTNLAIDLRNGIRLTKVMEIILLRDDLTKRLRVPAISRLQNIHNVELALKALQEADYKITGNITSADIVDGHREKTLSLLWQIIYKFRAPKFNAAAAAIQLWWRKSWLRVVIRRRIAEKLQKTKESAARRIQAAFRGYLCRRNVRLYREERTKAACILQSYIRRHLAIRQYQHKLTCIIRIQKWYRNCVQTQQARNEYVVKRQVTVKIQIWYRRCRLARQIEQIVPIIQHIKSEAYRQNCAALVLQKAFRANLLMRKTRREFLTLRKIAIFIQQRFKSILLMRSQRTEYLSLKRSAVTIQRRFRARRAMLSQRAEYLRIRNSTICIQKYFKSHVLMERTRSEYLELRWAITILQQHYRARLVMRQQCTEYKLLRNSAIIIQRRFVANLKMRAEQEKYQRLRKATIVLQSRYRARLEMVKQRDAYLRLKSACCVLQTRYRAHTAMTLQRFNYQQLRKATIIVQQRVTANVAMKRQRESYLQLKSAAIVCQTRFRANNLMESERRQFQRLRAAAICIQQRWRANRAMQIERTNYLKIKSAAIIVQRRLRANVLMMEQRCQYLCLKEATIRLQSQYRAQLAARKERFSFLQLRKVVVNMQRRVRANVSGQRQKSQYLQLRQAVVCVQLRFRANRAMKIEQIKYLHLRTFTLIIQRQFRANVEMKKQQLAFKCFRHSVVNVQQRFRAKLAMMKARAAYAKLRGAAVTIQKRFRAMHQMRQQKAAFDLLKHSAITVQRQFRALITMRKQRKTYQNLREKVICIQRRFRSRLVMKEKCAEFAQIKTATRTIQQYYRAQRLMRIERHQYLLIKRSTIIIQRRFVATVLMKQQYRQYQLIRKSTILIQTIYRANVQMKIQRTAYQQLKSAAQTVQHQFRAQMLMKKKRNQYQIVRRTIIFIQRHFIAQKLMKIERRNYEKLRNSTILIQRQFRATLLMRKQRIQYLQLRESVRTIQRRFIANKLMRTQCQQYQLMRRSTILIQTRYRATLQMRQQQRIYKQLRAAATTIQRQFRAVILMREKRDQYTLIRQSVIVIQQRFRAQRLQKLECDNYQSLKNSTITVQRRFRAQLMMRRDRREYFQLRQSTITIQRHFRAQLMMKRDFAQYQLVLKSTIIIQRRFVAQRMMKLELNKYRRLKWAVVFVQQKFRATRLGRTERAAYLKLRQCTICIQQYFRSWTLMKAERSAFTSLRQSAIFIQRTWRSKLLVRKMVNQYKLIRCLTICLQRKFRANVLMRQERRRFLNHRHAAILIQQKYHAQKQMHIERENYLRSRQTIVGLKARIQGYLARRNYLARLTPEMLLLKKQQKAARKIQAFWRGYVVRRQQPMRMRQIRQTIRVIGQNVQPQNLLRNKIGNYMQSLKGRINNVEALSILEHLVKISRIVPQLMVKDSNFIANFCYGIMSQAIRSEIDKQLIELCSCVILNLARYEPTKQFAYKRHGLTTVAQMLLRWCDKECGIFNTLCTVIWLFSRNPDMKEQIRQFMTTREAIYMLRETHKLVKRMENMRKNRAPNPKNPILTVKQKRQLPMILPDFGIVSRCGSTNKPYIFHCSVFAFDVVLANLSISGIF